MNPGSSLLLAVEGTNSALVAFAIYTAAVFFIAILSNRLRQSKNFLSEYFLGSRGLGVWAFALTFAATSSSGGSFMGFPSKVYAHGWVLALWIGSYMLVPVVSMGLLAKRINQVARKSGAITIPDVLRNRFDSHHFGTLATLLIVFFMVFNLVAQFKAGAKILTTLLQNVPVFQATRVAVGSLIADTVLAPVEPGYLICLTFFALAVIIYTSYGGFRAVVWTDVMQGIVMVAGVLILLPLALFHVGGLRQATDQMAKMTPPRFHQAVLRAADPVAADVPIAHGRWIRQTESDGRQRVFRTDNNRLLTIFEGETEAVEASDSSAPGTAAEIPVLEITTPWEIERLWADDRVAWLDHSVRVFTLSSEPYAAGAGEPGGYVRLPGPDADQESGFLPLSLAVSFFVMWTFSGAGQPSNMVRLMAFRSSQTLRRAIFTVAIYYSAIYFPLVVIFCCARVLLPGMEVDPDRIMPEIAAYLTSAAGWPWLAGLLVAAPFAAVMSTVDSFLLMISSAVVRDVYQQTLNPNASERTIQRMTYTVTLVVGVAALLGALNPPEYLQDIIVYTGSGLSGSFLMPMALALYWSRFNTPGAAASMACGFVTHLSLYGGGLLKYDKFQAIKIWDFDPLIPAMLVSLIAGVIVTLITPPPPRHLVDRYFRA